MQLRSGRFALIFVLVAAAGVATSSTASAAHQPRLGRCTMAAAATQSTVEVQIPDAADFCELVSQALGYDLFNAPMSVTPGRLWHYPGAAQSCRLRYRRTSDRARIYNADSACQWFLGLAPGWHLEAAAGSPGGRRHVQSGLRFGAATGSTPTVTFRPGVIGLFRSASIAVTGLKAHSIDVRLIGATDAAGLAYEWTPYRWRRLRPSRGAWRGVLSAPALPGIYQLQARLDDDRLVSSARWLLRVFPRRTMARPSSTTPGAAVRDFVARLPGGQILVAIKRWPQASFDHRDRRLHRLFVIAYAPRGNTSVNARVGLFITTVRDGFHGRWRVLEATTQPYD